MTSTYDTDESVAVVGMDCLLPGAHSPDEFWAGLLAGEDHRTEGGREAFGTGPEVPGGWGDTEHRITGALGGFVEEPDIDLTGLAVPEAELRGLDRTVHWSLHLVRRALAEIQGTGTQDRTGLVLGNYSFPTETSVRLCVPPVRQAVSEGLRAAGLPAGDHEPGPEPAPENLWPFGQPVTVTAEALGLGGPRLALDAACSSALYGISLACDYLLTGRADTMVAGAVCRPDPLLIHLSFSDLQAYPTNGVSQPFDSDSSGITTGQGAGVLVLKRLSDAIRDGDTVHAVLESIGLTNDGAGKHLLSPNARGQVETYRRAYTRVDPAEVDYIECHATGTPVGDSTEMRGLAEFYRERGVDLPLLGSVKGNVGHLLTVAGFTSVLKTVLALRYGRVPRTPGVAEVLRPEGAEHVADRIVREELPWPEHERVRRAAVSAFGFGGTNAHMVLAGPEAARSRSGTEGGKGAVPAKKGAGLAVTGLGVRVGALSGTADLERVVRSGERLPTGIPDTRWHGADRMDVGPLHGTGAQGSQPEGSYIDTIDVRTRTFRLLPNELGQANPQHLALFEAADQALEEGGYPAPDLGTKVEDLPSRRVAVVVAMEMEPRTHTHRARFDIGAHVRAECERAGVVLDQERMARLEDAVRGATHDPIGANEVLSYIGNVMASRISSSRNLIGPSFTMASDATSGARALEVAELLLLDPDIEAVLVGGVDLAAGPESTRAHARLADREGKESPVLGDGAAALVLTRPGTGEGQNRPQVVLEAVELCADPGPPETTLARAASRALESSGLGPDDIGYLGLGGSTGSDRLAEARALARVYSRDAGEEPDPHGCVLHSANGSTGNTGTAASLIAVVSAALSLRSAELPPAPEGLFSAGEGPPDDSGFTVLGEHQPWLARRNDAARAAALSIPCTDLPGGAAAAHVLLSVRAPRRDAVERGGGADWGRTPDTPLMVPFSGEDGAGLAAAARALLDRIEQGEDALDLVRDAVRAPLNGRCTAVVVADGAERLSAELTAAVRDLPSAIAEGGEWATPSGSFCTGEPLGGHGRVAFVYPGAFTTYPGAGRDLFRSFPQLRERFETIADRPEDRFKHRALYPRARGPLGRRELMRHEAELVEDIPTMLAAGTNLAVLNTQVLREALGVVPDGGFGYSLGESSMLFAMDVWDAESRDDAALAAGPLFRDQLRGRKERVRDEWDLPADLPDERVWATRVLLAPPEEVRPHMADLDRVFLTHVNTPGEVVVAGDPEQVGTLVKRVDRPAAKAPANHVMHCPVVDQELPALAELNDYPLGEPDPDLELLSAYDLDRVRFHDRVAMAGRIAWTLRSTIDFARLAETAHERGFRYFVEVGPGATCTRWLRETLTGRPHVAVSVDRRGAPTALSLARALARLVSHGLRADLAMLYPEPVTAQRSPSVRVVCGGESIAERVERSAAPVLAAPGPDTPLAPISPPSPQNSKAATAMTATAPEVPPVPVPDDEIVTMEAEPFVYLPAHQGPESAVPAARTEPEAGGQEPARAAGGQEPARAMVAMASGVAQAHRAALRAQHAYLDMMLEPLEEGTASTAPPAPPAPLDHPVPADTAIPAGAPGGASAPIWEETDLLEFAQGRIAPVFGPEFAEIDTYERRCRLPEPPYHFVSRVTHLRGRTGHFEPSEITTEYDVPVDAWYTVDGLVPCAVTIEAGQCDMLLISYLGVDFHNRGERVYRLLDSRLVFHGGLPREGQTLRYEIKVDRFVWNGDNLLFFFNYRCYADGELILELLDACAGFFTDTELGTSLGVVESGADRARRAAMTPTWFKPLARTARTGLNGQDLQLLAEGRPGEVFGAEWDQSADGSNPSVRLPDSMLRMVDEIPSIDRLGGPRGIGLIEAVKNLEPDAWYFTSHFQGDPVLAGSLVAEGGVQILQVYAMYLGMHLVFPDAEFQAVPGLETQVKVRGQITPKTSSIRYGVEITGLTMLPRPTVTADITVYDGDKPIVAMRDFGVQVREKPGTPYRPGPGGLPEFLGRRTSRGEAAFINELHLAHAAKGDLGTAMGPEFDIYGDRRAPHIPNGDFQFVDRIMRLDGERGVLKPGATMATEYDSSPEAWYYRDNSAPEPPHCVIMETSLQAAILLGYYLGATLASPDEELAIRNLDGRAAFVRRTDLRGRTIRHETEMLSSQAVPGATLQNFRYRLLADDEVFYEGESLFGYFSDTALANQAGLDSGAYVAPWLEEAGRNAERRDLAVRSDDHWFRAQPGSGLRLSDGHLRLVDELTLVEEGGEHGRGYLFGRRDIDPADWYFECHFHRDPVMPGSLGVEAVIQGLQAYVMDRGLCDGMGPVRFVTPLDVAMGWSYRGQILRSDGEMSFDAHIKEVRREEGRLLVIADANVWKPGLRIYELTDVAVEVRPVPQEEQE